MIQRVYLLPAVLAFSGPALLIVLTHGAFWPLALAWWLCAAVVGVIRNRRWRMIVTDHPQPPMAHDRYRCVDTCLRIDGF